MDRTATLSAYERERLENIRRNNERLKELGLSQSAPQPAPRQRPPPKQQRRREAAPQRASARVAALIATGAAPVTYADDQLSRENTSRGGTAPSADGTPLPTRKRSGPPRAMNAAAALAAAARKRATRVGAISECPAPLLCPASAVSERRGPERRLRRPGGCARCEGGLGEAHTCGLARRESGGGACALPGVLLCADPLLAVRARLEDAGIQTSMHFPPVHHLEPYRKDAAELAQTERIAARAMSLPLYPALSFEQIDRVCDELAAAI